jgi:hypothetical protein
MQNWNLAAGDPLSLTLSADSRLTDTDYTDDQIWELTTGGGEPAALALQTTYGLRAHWMRLIPRFVRSDSIPRAEPSPRVESDAFPETLAAARSDSTPRDGAVRLDPAGFFAPPRVTRFLPSYLEVAFAPFEGLDVVMEYRVCESQIVTGRIRFTNRSILPQNFRFEWAALLNPIDRQGGMVARTAGPSTVLTGETSYLCPVVFLTGGPHAVSSPYPALAHEIELYPGGDRQFSWAAAAMRTYEASLEVARHITARPWEAEMARAEMLDRSQGITITTGNAEWDAALAFTQQKARQLLHKNPQALPHASFVLSRQPDQGFSVRGDGSDQSHLWNGQTALDSYYLTSLLLPGAPELAAGLLRNFIAVQDETGRIDWKPGLSGQRSRRQAQPLLAALAVQLAPFMPLPAWYAEVFPALLRFFESWFVERCDQDGDGFPEWEHPLQTGIEDSPIFDRWSPGAQGLDISRIESPALAAMLLNECDALIQMANTLIAAEQADAAYARLASAVSGDQSAVAENLARSSGANDAIGGLRERYDALHALLDETWDENAHIYRYRDYATHLSLPGMPLMRFTGSGRATSRKRFPQPNRLVVHIQAREDRTYAVQVSVHGFTAEGECSEVIEPRTFSWMGHQARATTQNTFLAVKRVEATGLGDDDEVRVQTASYTQEDCSLLLPLWAGAPDEERARLLVDDALRPRYMGDYGIPVCPVDMQPQEELPGLHTALSSALMPWNHLLGEGLLRYGYRDMAASLVTRLMEAVVASLKTHQSFRQYYHSETGLAAGERGHLHGLAPVGLLLRVLGIRQFGPKEIILDGFNPFPFVIHVQYRRVILTCHPGKTEITYSGGQQVVVDRPGSHRIILT